tara:strand:- start:212 stop:490 length:279 start_codon:yes stop_codon:yes gene_type:complete
MPNKVTDIKSKQIKKKSIADMMGISELLDELSTFKCPILKVETKYSSVDESYKLSLLTALLILREQRTYISKKINKIDKTLNAIKENDNGKR